MMLVSVDFSGSMVTSLAGYGALMAVTLATGLIMLLTPIILAELSLQHVVDELAKFYLITAPCDPGPPHLTFTANGV